MVAGESGAILTVGHSNHALDDFLALLEGHAVTALADVRSAPYSRFLPHFNRSSLEEGLGARGIRYVYLGDALGGRPRDPSCYEDGRIRYDRVAATESFRSGLVRVVQGAARYRVALMCAEAEPLDCHRTLLVARALDREGLHVEHILADGALEPHSRAMDRLLESVDLSRPDMYATREERIALAITAKARRVGYMDRGEITRTGVPKL